MKYLFIFLIASFLFSCKKDSGSVSSYYFKTNIDSLKFDVTYSPNPGNGVSPNNAMLSGSVSTSIKFNCSWVDTVTLDGIIENFEIFASNTGTFSPQTFDIQINKANDFYMYKFDNPYGTDTSFKITITKIDHEMSEHNNKGFLQGNFEGTVMRYKMSNTGYFVADGTAIVSGNFSCPLN